MTVPAKSDVHDLDIGAARLTATSVEWLRAPTLDEWSAAFRWIKRCQTGVQWWCGEMVLAGENMFSQEASQEFDKETHRRWAWVCEKVVPSMRRKGLSFTHHEAVARLEPREQRHFLDMAEREGLSANELKRRIKADESLPEDDDKEPCPTCGKPWDGIYKSG